MRNIGKQLHATCVGCIQLYTARSRTHSTPDLPTVYNPHKLSVAAYQHFSFINLKMANEKGRNM